MPHRSMSIKEVAVYLHLSPGDIERLVKERDIPCEKQGDRVIFRRADIDGWASQRILNLPSNRLSEYHTKTSTTIQTLSPHATLMPRLLTVDRLNPELRSKTRASVIRDMAELADQTDLVSDKSDLIRMIEEREALCSTAIPGGLALLHPRHHDPYMFTDSFMIIGRTIQPIHFGAEDGSPTDLFFLVCCQDDRFHLHTLARICTLCLETEMLAGLRTADSAQAMLALMLQSEEALLRKS